MDTWGQVLKRLRETKDLSVQALAVKVAYSRPWISNVENGRRNPNEDFAGRCDEALGTAPLLVTLLDMTEGDDVRRRAVLGAVGAIGVSALGLDSLARLVQDDIWSDVSGGIDYDAIVSTFGRQFVVNASDQYGKSLLGQLLVLKAHIKESPSVESIRAYARLTELYGLWRGNERDFAGASGWYATAAMLAERAMELGDSPQTLAYIEARTANRKMFEGASFADVRAGIDRALSLAPPAAPGLVEAYAAEVCLSALTGNTAEGRRALRNMLTTVDRLPSNTGVTVTNLYERALFHAAYLESRCGTLRDGEAACEAALCAYPALPYWRVETELYHALALTRHGDVHTGVERALTSLRTGPINHVIQVAARNVVATLPADLKSDNVIELRGYASQAPGPWETLAA